MRLTKSDVGIHVTMILGLWFHLGTAETMNASTQSLSQLDTGMAASSEVGYSYNWAKSHCDSLGGNWYIAYINHQRGSLYCLRRGTGTGSNCNNCNTYRIVVWKNGGGEYKHCPIGGQRYATSAGYVYPSHVRPCACTASSLGPPCYRVGQSVGGYYSAKSYCDRMGGWYIAYTNQRWGELYCLRRGTGTGSNCNNCNTYRIVVWKNGGGEHKHCPSGNRPYNTRAGYVYPAHVNPCACGVNTLGGACASFPMVKRNDQGSYGAAKAYCDRLGGGWYIAYTNKQYGELYCLRRGTGTGSNCNNCNTYRIVVWKGGGGEHKHCPIGGARYNTRAGYVYPAHVSPCACGANTLGGACASFSLKVRRTTTTTTTTKVYQIKMVTWVMPEFLSWTVVRGNKKMCKSGAYTQWYSTVSTGCMLPKGNYKLTCMDKKGQGFKGGYISIAGKKYCHKNFMWRAGPAKSVDFTIPR